MCMVVWFIEGDGALSLSDSSERLTSVRSCLIYQTMFDKLSSAFRHRQYAISHYAPDMVRSSMLSFESQIISATIRL